MKKQKYKLYVYGFKSKDVDGLNLSQLNPFIMQEVNEH